MSKHHTLNQNNPFLLAYSKHIIDNYNNGTYVIDGTSTIRNKDFSISFEPGSKFLKVVSSSYGANCRTVHSFIVLKDTEKFIVGDILKAASWAAPAKNFKRGNVFDPSSYKHILWTGC